LLIEAIKELKVENDALRKRPEALEKKLNYVILVRSTTGIEYVVKKTAFSG